MPKLIVADENEGRRNLLAGTLERAGYDVTRAGTLRQAEGTALATMPEIVLIDGEWKTGDAIDASQRLMSDPEFAFKCRIVILSRNVSQDYLVSAARASVNEVIPKPVDMNKLLAQLEKHSRKQFVPPPAEVSNAAAGGGGGSFDVSMVMSDGKWALPMLKGIVTPEKINVDFINEILGQLGEEGIEVEEGLPQRRLHLGVCFRPLCGGHTAAPHDLCCIVLVATVSLLLLLSSYDRWQALRLYHYGMLAESARRRGQGKERVGE